MLFVLVMFKSVLHVVLCVRYGVLWCKRGEAVEKRRGGGGGGGRERRGAV